MFMPHALSKSIDRIARQAAGKDWNLYASLLEYWQEIVGSDYARNTTPVKITFPHQPNEAHRSNGTLYIRLPKGLAMEFSFKTDLIRQRINTYFGYDAIAKITFDPIYETPSPPPAKAAEPDPAALAKIHQAAAAIEDEKVRAALQSFGEAVLMGKSRKT